MSLMRDTTIRNPEQLGRAIRLKRKEQGLSQSALAERLGVGRKWVLGVESGNPKAEFGLILKTLELLGLHTSLSEKSQLPSTKDHRQTEPSRLDEVFRRLQQPRSK
jgi:transcriptional regulator with XRE-family HTH domain